MLQIAGDAAQRRRRLELPATMPILSYFAVIGAVLVALLFVTDATFEKPRPLWFSSEFTGLPKAWHAETLNPTVNPAPEPAMTSDAVKAAPTSPAAAAATNGATAMPTVPPEAKKKRVARKHPLLNAGDRRYAWRPRGSEVRGHWRPWRF